MVEVVDGMRRPGGCEHLKEFWPEAVRELGSVAGPPVGRSAKVLKTAVILIWNWNHTKIGLQQVLISAAKRKITKKIGPKKF